jgi:hypothetical protein
MPYKDKLKQKESHRRWHLRNREKVLQQQKKYWFQVKMKVFNYYSKEIVQCACCGEKEIKFLSVDHIHGQLSLYNM